MVFSTQFSKIKESGIIWKLIVLLYISVGAAFTIFGYSKAVTVRTVCDAACDFTTIDAAVAASGANDVVRVTSSYTGIGEAASIVFGTSLMLECVGGPIVGNAGATTTIAISANSTVQNCTFLRTALTTTGLAPTSILVTGNTFVTSQYSSIDFGSSSGMIVSNNINIKKVFLDTAGLANPTLTGNTFYVSSGDTISASSVAGTSLTITNNTFTGYTEIPFAGQMVNISGPFTNVTFATNTVNLAIAQTNTAYSAIKINFTSTLDFSGNQISLVDGIVKGGLISSGSGSVVTIRNNTIKYGYDPFNSNGAAAIEIDHAAGGSTADISYNIFYNTYSTTGPRGLILIVPGGSIALTNDYNAYYGETFSLATDRIDVTGTVTGSTVGTNSKTNIAPHFRIWNLSTTDDLWPAPYSDYYDVNGSLDIGAHSDVRRLNIYVDAAATAATINYSTVDTTSTIPILNNSNRFRSGTVVHVAAGSYLLTTFSATMCGEGLTIQGAGSGSTIFTGDTGGAIISGLTSFALSGATIHAAANAPALTLLNTSSSVFSNLIFDNAISATTTYYSSNPIYSYLGTSYNQGNLIGGVVSTTLILSDSSCGMVSFSGDNTEVTNSLNGTSNVHIALVNAVGFGGAYLTALIPNNFAANASALAAQCGGNVVVDRWVADAYTVSSGAYTYNAATVSTAGLTMVSGFTNPPYIYKSSGYAGIKLVGSGYNTFTSVTSTGNGYGVMFTGTSTANIFQDSSITSNTSLDIISLMTSGYNNYFNNTSFSHSLVDIVGSSFLTIKQKIYVTVKDAYNTLIGGATVAYSSANASVTGSLTTLNTGISDISSVLTSSIYSSAGHTDTTGGYNPYTFSISATSTYLATSTSASLISPYQTVTLYMTTTSSGGTPTPDTGGGSSSQGTAPSITSFFINSGALKTATTTVNIILSAAEAVTMVVSEDVNFIGMSTTAFLQSFVAHLSQTPGIKTLYAKVYNAQGLASSVASSTIQYDPQASSTSTLPTVPTGSIVFSGPIVGGATSSTNVGVGISYSAGVSEMKISGLSDLQGATWQTAATTTPWTLSSGDGIKRVYIKFRTAEGIESSIYSTSVQLDQTPPSEPQFLGAIERGSFTEQPTIISGTADNLTGLRISLIKGGKTVSTFTETSNASGVWDISVPKLSLGRYVVNARAYDAIGNESSVASTYFDIVAATTELPPPEKKIVDKTTPPPTTPPEPGVSGDKTVGSVGDQGVGTPPPATPTTPGEIVPEIPVVTLPNLPLEASAPTNRVGEQVSVATAEVTKVVAASVKRASQAVVAAQNSPQVQTVNQAVVVPTVAVAAAASVGSAVNGVQAINYLKFLFTQPFFLLARKRRKGWGTVYNAITKMPMDLATVRLVDAQTGRVVQSQVTDKLGRYQFFAKPGDFRLDVAKPDYQFPADYLKGKTEDGKFSDLYTGDVIHPVSAATISYNTPLDPVGADKPVEELLKLARKKKIAAVVGNLGLIATAISLVVSPTPLVAGFLVIHVASHFMFKRLAIAKKPETWGVISDSAGKPLENAIVRVFDKQYNKLLETQITDDKGRYAFLVGKNDYYMMIEKPGYEKVVTEAISVPESEGGSVLAKNVQILSNPLTV